MIGTFTILSHYLNCPHAMYRRYIKKDGPPYVETPEMKWGNDVHSAFEHRIGSMKPLPEKMRAWECFAVPFDGKMALCEQKLAINRDNKPTGYWDKGCYFRGKNDVTVAQDTVGYLCDFKTGKSTYEDPFELETNALLLKAKKPQLAKIVGSYCWLKESRMGQLYDLSNFEGTWNRIRELMGKIESKKPEEFEKHKSGLCGWCSVSDCEHHFVARK